MPDLPRRPLGGTGMDVTVLAYGAMELRGCPSGDGCHHRRDGQSGATFRPTWRRPRRARFPLT